MSKKFKVLVRLKSGVLDVQGKAIEQSVASLGIEGIEGVRVGKLIELTVKDLSPGLAKDHSGAKDQVERACRELLVNSVIEDYEIEDY